MMDSDTLTNAVIVTGLVMGSLTLLSAIWVWYIKQTFGYGGTLLSFFGAVLIGLSVFSRAEIRIGEVEITIERLAQRVESLQEINTAMSTDFIALAKNVELQRSQFVMLSNSMRSANPDVSNAIEDIVRPLNEAQAVDTARLAELLNQPRELEGT